nr:probable myosin light chain kinase DDB_G0279831 [Ciona intestinalis]|eukprot:XP_002126872.1 probable myosin light chain kinase DDB_G0279831 [Ciona intestinalis]
MPTKDVNQKNSKEEKTKKKTFLDDSEDKTNGLQNLDLVLAQLCSLDKALENTPSERKKKKNDDRSKKNSDLHKKEVKPRAEKLHGAKECARKGDRRSQCNHHNNKEHDTDINANKVLSSNKRTKKKEEAENSKLASGLETKILSVNGSAKTGDTFEIFGKTERQNGNTSKLKKVNKRTAELDCAITRFRSCESFPCGGSLNGNANCKTATKNILKLYDSAHDINYEEEALRRNLSLMSFSGSCEKRPRSINRLHNTDIMRGRCVSGDNDGPGGASSLDIEGAVEIKQGGSEYRVHSGFRSSGEPLSQISGLGNASSKFEAVASICDCASAYGGSLNVEAIEVGDSKKHSLEDGKKTSGDSCNANRSPDENQMNSESKTGRARSRKDGSDRRSSRKKTSKNRESNCAVEDRITRAIVETKAGDDATSKRKKERNEERARRRNHRAHDVSGLSHGSKLNGSLLASELEAKMKISSTKAIRDISAVVRPDSRLGKTDSKSHHSSRKSEKRKDKTTHRVTRKEKEGYHHESRRVSSDEGLPRSPPQTTPISPACITTSSPHHHELLSQSSPSMRHSKSGSHSTRNYSPLSKVSKETKSGRNDIDRRERSRKDAKHHDETRSKQKGSRIAESLKWHTEVQAAQVTLRPERRSTKQSKKHDQRDSSRNAGCNHSYKIHKSTSSSRSSAYTSCSSVSQCSDSFSGTCSSPSSSESDRGDYKLRPHVLRNGHKAKTDSRSAFRHNSGAREKPSREDRRGYSHSPTAEQDKQTSKNKRTDTSSTVFRRRQRHKEDKHNSSTQPLHKTGDTGFGPRRRPKDVPAENEEYSSKWQHHRLVVVSQKPTAEFLSGKPQNSRTPPTNKRRISPQQKTSSSEDTEKKSPTIRDLYSLHNVLSDTQNGTVISGYRRSDGMRVAIKRISKAATTRWGWLGGKVVPLELALLCQVNEVRCTGVVEIVEWHETTEAFLLVMVRPHPAVDLYDYVSKHKRVKEPLARHIIRQLINCLQHCLKHGVLHRDIKLENILINPESMDITLIDFGCGDYVRSGLYKEFAGTPEYYAPEWFLQKQYYGEGLTVWSVGVLLYSLLCGSLPFRSAKDITEKEITKFPNDISRNGRDLLASLLQKNPRDRIKLGAVMFHLFFKYERGPNDGVGSPLYRDGV